MSEINVILAPMAGRTICTTKTVYQYNSGMILRFVGIDLPEAYVVDFANSVTGTSISQVGGENGVTIPDQFFTPGSTIHAWYVAVGTGYAVTRYHIMIPISPRASRTNDTPTPSQQSALDEAIAALNDAVDAAETAITHYPTVIDGYWHVWDVSAGEYVSTGVSAEGTQGPTGPQGPAGADGVGVPSGGTAGQVLSKASGTDYDTEWVTLNPVVQVSGSTPTITALPGVRYVCGEVSTLALTVPALGCVDVVFESGSTPTVLTITSAKSGVTAIKWANGWDETCEANTTYEINILDGEYGVVGSWT